MPAKKTDDQNLFGDGGELSQELIDAMLNGGGGDGGDAEPEPAADPWADDSLQAEIDAARLEAGLAPEPDNQPFAAPVAVAAPPMAAPVAAAAPAPAARPRAAAPSAVPTAVHPVQFMPLTPDPPALDQAHGIELLMDVALEVSVELGRSHMSIGEILALRTGSVIELDKLAGEPVDVSVNGTLIARGEVVVVDEKFGVRITEVVSKARRLASVG
jgi:flagellar motor switch protein FliN/FliY